LGEDNGPNYFQIFSEENNKMQQFRQADQKCKGKLRSIQSVVGLQIFSKLNKRGFATESAR
jgi:hypothetical protein